MPGPPPTPIELRLLRGNPAKRAIRGGFRPPRPPDPPEPPEFLSAAERAEWERVAPELWRLGVLTELDISTFAVYCWAAATWATAVKALNEVAARDPVMHGLLVKGADGPTTNPLIRVARQASETMLEVAAQFGMTPAARARISAGWPAGPPGPSKFDGLLGGVDPDPTRA
jgi:P27 family predicted phage terminase small subunit